MIYKNKTFSFCTICSTQIQQYAKWICFKKKTNLFQTMYIYKYCVSNESFQQTVNSNPIVRYIVRAICKKRLDSSSIETEIKKIKLLDRKNLLTTKTTQKAQVLPLTVTYDIPLTLQTSQYKPNNSKSLAHLKD